MSIVDILRNKNVKFSEAPNWGIVLRKNWIDNFASHLSKREKEEIYIFDNGFFVGYLWHLFSYNKRECLKGEEADKTFNELKKNCCYIFYQHDNTVLIIEDARNISVNDFEDEMDVYVVDKSFKWTYVKTHETGWCGPYFCRRDTKI